MTDVNDTWDDEEDIAPFVRKKPALASAPQDIKTTPASDPRLDEWEKLANAATPGPWDIDTINVDGSYGSGDTGGEGYNSYEVHSADGKCLFDAINSDAAMIDEEPDEYGTRHAWDEIARQNLTFVAAARTAIPALIGMVREMEKELKEARDAGYSNDLVKLETIDRVAAEARATAAEARVKELEEALRPFVEYVHDDLRAGQGTYALVPTAPIAGGWIGAEDLRAAAAAYGRAEK